jgi:hypothetical protein
MPYDPADNVRSLHDEEVVDEQVEADVQTIQANISLLARARSYMAEESWAYITGTAQARIDELRSRLSSGGTGAETLDQINRLRGFVDGLSWVQGLPGRVEQEIARLEDEMERLQVGQDAEVLNG